MSVDGSGIIESDLAHDVYSEILDLYDSGVSVEDIYQRISTFETGLVDDMELEIYLAASTKALWEIGLLDEARHSRLSRLFACGASLALWSRDSENSLAEERRTVLQRLLRQTSSPRKIPRARKKYSKVKRKLFAVGDCIQLQAENKIYRGVVCRVLEYRDRCEYAILVMSPETTASIESFTTGYYYGHRISSALHKCGFLLGPHVIRPEHRMLVRAKNPFEVVGQVNLDISKFALGSFGGVLEMNHVIQDFERTQTNSAVFGQDLLPLKELFTAGVNDEV